MLFTLDVYTLELTLHLVIGIYSLYLGEILLSTLTIILIKKRNRIFLTQTLYFLLLVVLLGGIYDILRLYSISRLVTYIIEFILIVLILLLLRGMKLSIE